MILPVGMFQATLCRFLSAVALICAAMAFPSVPTHAACPSDCPPRYCLDPPAAAKAKAEKKARLARKGYPPRLTALVDRLPDCVACVHGAGEAFHIDVYYDRDLYEKARGARPLAMQSYAWTPRLEQQVREDMKTGLVKRFLIDFTYGECACCGQPRHDQRLTWDGEAGIDSRLALDFKDPATLGPEPPDLNGGGPLPPFERPKCRERRIDLPPPERIAQALCPACADEAEERNSHARRLNEALYPEIERKKRKVQSLECLLRGARAEIVYYEMALERRPDLEQKWTDAIALQRALLEDLARATANLKDVENRVAEARQHMEEAMRRLRDCENKPCDRAVAVPATGSSAAASGPPVPLDVPAFAPQAPNDFTGLPTPSAVTALLSRKPASATPVTQPLDSGAALPQPTAVIALLSRKPAPATPATQHLDSGAALPTPTAVTALLSRRPATATPLTQPPQPPKSADALPKPSTVTALLSRKPPPVEATVTPAAADSTLLVAGGPAASPTSPSVAEPAPAGVPMGKTLTVVMHRSGALASPGTGTGGVSADHFGPSPPYTISPRTVPRCPACSDLAAAVDKEKESVSEAYRAMFGIEQSLMQLSHGLSGEELRAETQMDRLERDKRLKQLRADLAIAEISRRIAVSELDELKRRLKDCEARCLPVTGVVIENVINLAGSNPFSITLTIPYPAPTPTPPPGGGGTGGGNVLVILSGVEYIPVTRLRLAATDVGCPDPNGEHYHRDFMQEPLSCNGVVVPDPAPANCGYGRTNSAFLIPLTNCANHP